MKFIGTRVVKFYLKELNGNLGQVQKLSFRERLKNILRPVKQELLKTLIGQNINKTILSHNT